MKPWKRLAAGLGLAFSMTALPASAALTLTLVDPERDAALGTTERFVGTISNTTGADLNSSELFFNFFDIDDASQLNLVQLLGVPDLLIADGQTSALLDLFDADLAPTAELGATYVASLVLQSARDDFSEVATVRLHVAPSGVGLPQPATLPLVALSLLVLAFCAARRRGARLLRGGVALTGLLLAAATHAQSTGVTLVTGQAGTATDDPQLLRVALPVRNMGGTEALDLRVTHISMRNAPTTSPLLLPQAVGNVGAGGIFKVEAAFDRTALAGGSVALLTVTGDYRVGASRYGFALNRAVTVPQSVPSRFPLRSSVVTSRSFTPFGTYPVPESMPFGMANPNPPRPPTPESPPRDLFPFISPSWGINRDGYLPPGSGAPTFSFGPGGPFGTVRGNPPDPSGASGGGVVLTTVNTTAAISLDGGRTFTNINPACLFGYVTCNADGKWANGAANYLVDGNLCCDQVVIYAPAINRFIWLMQTWPNNWPDGTNLAAPPGNNRVRLVSVSPEDVRNWAFGRASTWQTLDLTTQTFGMGANQWLDYPSLAISNNFLYLSIDQFGVGLLVARIPLVNIATAGQFQVDWLDPSWGGTISIGSHLMQNTQGVMYWAAHNGTDKLRVFSMDELDDSVAARDVAINSYRNNDYRSITPSGTNWMMGSKGWGMENVLGAVLRRPRVVLLPGEPRPPDELWFAWGAGVNVDAGRRQPYVELVRLRSSDLALQEQINIWNPDFGFGYPTLAINDNDEIAIHLGLGGGTEEAASAVGFLGDYAVYVPARSTCSRGRFGDYLGLRRSGNNGKLFAATGYRNTGPSCVFDPSYNEFGRYCDVNPGACQIK